VKEQGNLIGKRFGTRIVLKRMPNYPNNRNCIWLVQCDCGDISSVYGSRLKRGVSPTCTNCCIRHKPGTQIKHGLKKTPEYRTWRGMKYRCLCSTSASWQYYGGRGISIYEPWLHDFKAFYDYVGEKPEPKHLYSIDRIDNNGNYEPGNLRWATIQEQNANRRNTK